MDRLVDRNFRLVLDADINVWIGANFTRITRGATTQAVTKGEMKTWAFQHGSLVLDGVWFSIQKGKEVVVRLSVNEGTHWRLIMPEPEVLQIATPDLDLFWTVNSTDPDQPVKLEPPSEELAKFQLFRFKLIH